MIGTFEVLFGSLLDIGILPKKETNMNKTKCLKFLANLLFYGLLASVVIISIVRKWDPYIIPFWILSFFIGIERWYKKYKAKKDKK